MKINKQRIKFLIKKQSLKQMDVARKIDVTPQDFTNWMFRGIFPHFQKLEQLANILEVEVDTLYTQEGLNEPEGSYRKRINFSTEELIPYFELDAKMGLSLLWQDSLTNAIPKDYIHIPGLVADMILPYYGKGMDPMLENGDLMALRRIKDFSFLNFGTIHLIVTKEQVLVRKVTKGKGSNLSLSTISKGDEVSLALSGIKALYTIVSVVKRKSI